MATHVRFYGYLLLVMCWIPPYTGYTCRGTSNGLDHRGSQRVRFEMYRDMYTNCTYVEGNLELVFLDTLDNFDLGFLSQIREVSGYVLILAVYSRKIPLTSLRIIRGTQLYVPDDGDTPNPRMYSLYVVLNAQQNDPSVIHDNQHGLRELQWVSLSEIMNGDVYFHNNFLLCHENTINWNDIFTEPKRQSIHFHNTGTQRQCPECDVNCTVSLDMGGVQQKERHCWGTGASMCQKLNKVICSDQCDGRCYGPLPRDCCHKECAGGCDGPRQDDCWACNRFEDDGECVAECPPAMRYNPQTYQLEKNPDAKNPYVYGSRCVPECPLHMVRQDKYCVQDCKAGEIVKENVCVPCDGPCPKSCTIQQDASVDASTIVGLVGCTIIKGNLLILEASLNGDPGIHIPALHPSKLSVLESIKEVTGHVLIQGKHPDFKDLSFLRNLEIIYGRELTTQNTALQIAGTSLESVNLHSLKKVKNGMMVIIKNPELCYAKSINWNSIKSTPRQKAVVIHNKNSSLCVAEGKVCDNQCLRSKGCWGPGEENCLQCANFHLDNVRCLQSCSPSLGIYQAYNNTCMRCHHECKLRCDGANANNCEECRHYTDGPFCVSTCPAKKYPDENNICQNCHENCVSNCSGPLNFIGEGGCTDCNVAIVDEDYNVTRCLQHECPEGYYDRKAKIGPMKGKKVCLRCHDECKSCYGPQNTQCDKCMNYNQEGVCVSNCSNHYYANNENSFGLCDKCHTECNGCRGPTTSDCLSCRMLKVYWPMEHATEVDVPVGEEDTTDVTYVERFNCTGQCPEWASYTQYFEHDGVTETICSNDPKLAPVTSLSQNKGVVIGIPVSIFLALLICGVLVVYFCKQRAKSEENKHRLMARMSGLDESEPLTPTDAKPDMAVLRLIKESELRRGNIIGSGAFGTVYKGVWIPEGETVRIPVAIKVLQEGTSPSQNKELLEEARIMASVDHPCCIRILAVCMTAQMMLVTQLMPFGCLLDYVRKNKANIGSKALLNWCTQIAKGMQYLEDRAVVHRDLAARNVLVQNPGQIKITDFGLAKLLDYNEDVFHAAGGKMPIKWLALECIQHRVFTHKSDVWSFGVTIWELFTYGQRPYENVRARDIPDLLEKGERLPQPSMCTIDVYMIMIKCWMLDAASRPAFKELGEEFAKMARDPGRYLVIHGDKYMRLPSCSYDAKDLIRNMSIANDTPEDFRVVEAEDYLQPRSTSIDTTLGSLGGLATIGARHPNGRLEKVSLPPINNNQHVREDSNYDNDHNTSSTALSTAINSRENSRERDCPPPLNPNSARREKKYSGLDAELMAKKQRDAVPHPRDSINSRYSSDPCKVLMVKEDGTGEMPDQPPPPTPLAGAMANGPGLVTYDKAMGDVKLPVDEDDYLQPKSSNPRAYVDLVEGSAQDYLEGAEGGVKTQSQYMDMSPPHSPSHEIGELPSNHYAPHPPIAVDNPEYYSSNSHEHMPNVGVDHLKMGKRPMKMSQLLENEGATGAYAPENDYYNDLSGGHAHSNHARPNPNTSHTLYMDHPRTESAV